MRKICFIANLFPSEKDPSFGSFVGKNYEQLKSHGNEIVSKIVIDYRTHGIYKLLTYVKFVARGIRAIAKRDYDYVYFHYLTYSTLCLIPFLFINRPKYVINIHGDDLVGVSLTHRVMGFFSALILRHSAAVIVPSTYFKDCLLDLYPWYQKNKIIVSPSAGVEFALFKPTLCSDREGFVLGYVSRIDEGKGWQELLEALALIKETQPHVLSNFKLKMYGTGSQVGELTEKILNLKLSSLVSYFGALKPNELVEKYQEMDAFIFPTHRESFGLVAVEALACGIPVLASNINPVNEIVIDGKNGLHFEAKNEASIAQKIIEIVTMKSSDYRILCSNARESVSQYNSTQVASDLVNELNQRIYNQEY
ncbi:glycosyltransferase family 4 protein [Pseudoalteromonas xiamenensis]|uniref:glycosyltransferase family 4 protein n=1 Tax=Pseudoalteromonas xiamenensis TaxID=882626 RepID=UPI0027E3B920|nr:glycosyltransferase family 4 protein [Pseudoalteromonas xiamenensis]WMN61194.1 glycosyltransferase family 4 protein [Pseudoalteromonas xiamenensis]